MALKGKVYGSFGRHMTGTGFRGKDMYDDHEDHQSSNQDMLSVFLTQEAFNLNKARENHLKTLGLPLSGKRVLEVGAGIGLLTAFFEDLGCEVISTDGRADNVAEIKKRYPHRHAEVLNLDNTPDLTYLGSFDIIFCYGVLYHLSRPEEALKALAAICNEMILISACVTPGDQLEKNPTKENDENPNQALSGFGCRPTRRWMISNVKKYFGHAYVTATQPIHADYTLNWIIPGDRKNHRAVFVGSKHPIENPNLLEALPDFQAYELMKPPANVHIRVGESNLPESIAFAESNPSFSVYVFAANAKGIHEDSDPPGNLHILPLGIGECDGFSPFYYNNDLKSGSPFPPDPDKPQGRNRSEADNAFRKFTVPTMRLDTFLNATNIAEVEELKIDETGAGFGVLVSAGRRITDIGKIRIGIPDGDAGTFLGITEKSVVSDYLERNGFVVTETDSGSRENERYLTFIKDKEGFSQVDRTIARRLEVIQNSPELSAELERHLSSETDASIQAVFSDGSEKNADQGPVRRLVGRLVLIRSYPKLIEKIERHCRPDEEISKYFEIIRDYPNLFAEIEKRHLNDGEAVKRLALAENYPELVLEIENHWDNDRLVSKHLRTVRNHPELISEIEKYWHDDVEATKRLQMARYYPELVTEVLSHWDNDRFVANRLQMLRNYSETIAEVENYRHDDRSAANRLRTVQQYTDLFATLDRIENEIDRPDIEERLAALLTSFMHHQHFFDYILDCPDFIADFEHYATRSHRLRRLDGIKLMMKLWRSLGF